LRILVRALVMIFVRIIPMINPMSHDIIMDRNNFRTYWIVERVFFLHWDHCYDQSYVFRFIVG
jgi:hypothetical protein